MNHPFDELTKSLAEEAIPRRESLRRFGAALIGGVLTPLGLAASSEGAARRKTASRRKGGGGTDPCISFCRRCKSKSKPNNCIDTCRACGNDPNKMQGTCGAYVCCGPGQTFCNGACVNTSTDNNNCGGCGNACGYGSACVSGACTCASGFTKCNGTCVNTSNDINNFGACGNVCGGTNPSCYQGACSQCTPSCPEGWCGGNGCGGICSCPDGMNCEQNGWCSDPCAFPFILCGGVCVDPTSDRSNCGGCGVQCSDSEACLSGFCESF